VSDPESAFCKNNPGLQALPPPGADTPAEVEPSITQPENHKPEIPTLVMDSIEGLGDSFDMSGNFDAPSPAAAAAPPARSPEGSDNGEEVQETSHARLLRMMDDDTDEESDLRLSFLGKGSDEKADASGHVSEVTPIQTEAPVIEDIIQGFDDSPAASPVYSISLARMLLIF
jgi:hypothetical protein